jgi:hypothetical protein
MRRPTTKSTRDETVTKLTAKSYASLANELWNVNSSMLNLCPSMHVVGALSDTVFQNFVPVHVSVDSG